MFKKRALLLFFLINSLSLFAEDSPMEIVTTAYEAGPKVIYADGIMEIDKNTTPITIEIKNNELFKSEILIQSEEDIELPNEILNYQLINREYSLLRSISYRNLNSYRVLMTKPQLQSEDEENLIEIDDFPYDKIIYTISNYPRMIVKKEYFKNRDDRNPLYEIEVDNILHIKDYHIATAIIIRDVKAKKETLLKINIDRLNFGGNP